MCFCSLLLCILKQAHIHIKKKKKNKLISIFPTSLANCRPTSKVFASTSKAPTGAPIFLLKAATTNPLSSRIMTPTSDSFHFENIAPSTLTLYCEPDGGDHLPTRSEEGVGGTTLVAWYSWRYYLAHRTSSHSTARQSFSSSNLSIIIIRYW